MRKRSKGSTGRRRSIFDRRGRSIFHPARKGNLSTAIRRRSRRRNAGDSRNTVYTRSARRRLSDFPERSRRSASARQARDELPVRPGKRRNKMRQSRQGAARGLSPVALSLRRNNENASDLQTTRSVCTRKKATRRAVIIANGYGGINGFKDYKPNKRC